MIKNNRNLQMKELQARLGSIFDNLIDGVWLDEFRLTTKEAAAVLGITPNALRIRVHRRKIEAEKLDEKLRFKLSNVLSSFKIVED